MNVHREPDTSLQLPPPVKGTLEQTMARINALADEQRAYRVKLEQWAGDKPQSEICNLHRQERKINWDKSLAESYAQKKFLLYYEKCPGCDRMKQLGSESSWLEHCGVPKNLLHCRLSNFTAATDQQKENLKVAEKFSRARHGFLCMLGEKYGTGKTHLGVALMYEAKGGFIITNNELLSKIRETYSNNRAENIRDRCKRTRLLVLDDLGFSCEGRDELPLIHEILNHRHGQKLKTVINGNVSTKDQFYELVGPRMQSRLSESGYKMLWFKGEDMRPAMKQAYFDGDEKI